MIDLTLPEIIKSLGMASASFGAVYLAFDSLQANAGKNLNKWFKNKFFRPSNYYQKTSLPNWTEKFQKLLDPFFGRKHFSWKCFLRSSLVSLFSVLILFIFFSLIKHTSWDSFLSYFRSRDLYLLAFAATYINCIADFFSLWESRLIIKRISNTNSNFKVAFLLILDLLFTSTIFIFISILAIFCSDVKKAGLSGAFEFLSILGEIDFFQNFIVSISDFNKDFSVLFYSTFSTSIWLWFFVLATFSASVIKKFRQGRRLLYCFQIRKAPIRAMGFIAGSFSFLFVLIGSLLLFALSTKVPA